MPHVRSLGAPIVVLLASVAIGSWTLVGQFLAYGAYALAPTTLGVPFAIPGLRLTPLGGTTWGFWAAETGSALLMVGLVLLAVRQRSRRPFRQVLRAVILAVVVANLVRLAFVSFITHADVPTVLVGAGLTALLSVVWALPLGLLAGLVDKSVAPRDRATAYSSADPRGEAALAGVPDQ